MDFSNHLITKIHIFHEVLIRAQYPLKEGFIRRKKHTLPRQGWNIKEKQSIQSVSNDSRLNYFSKSWIKSFGIKQDGNPQMQYVAGQGG